MCPQVWGHRAGLEPFQRVLTASVVSCLEIKVPLTEFRGRCQKVIGGGGGDAQVLQPKDCTCKTWL